MQHPQTAWAQQPEQLSRDGQQQHQMRPCSCKQTADKEGSRQECYMAAGKATLNTICTMVRVKACCSRLQLVKSQQQAVLATRGPWVASILTQPTLRLPDSTVVLQQLVQGQGGHHHKLGITLHNTSPRTSSSMCSPGNRTPATTHSSTTRCSSRTTKCPTAGTGSTHQHGNTSSSRWQSLSQVHAKLCGTWMVLMMCCCLTASALGTKS